MTFGERLKEIRLSRDMSQEELATLFGTSKQVISRYENNQRTPKISVAYDYAQKLGVDLNYLLGDEKKLAANRSDDYELSHDDEALLKLFRLVPPEKKQYILGLIEGALRSSGLLK